MSDLVKRLAERATKELPEGLIDNRVDARWWINAIADELEDADNSLTVVTCLESSDWLRSQTKESE